MRRLRWPALVALALALLYLACFATLSLVRFRGYHTRSFDLAIVERMLWGLRHGQFTEVFTGQPWIAYHFEPILLPLALVDALLPSPEWLLVFQTLALALAALPAWRLGCRVLGGETGGLIAALVVLAFPVVGQTNLFELHPIAFAVAPGLWLIEGLAADRHRQAALAALLVLSCREDGFLFVAVALLADRLTWRRAALAVAAVLAYVVWVVGISARSGTLASAHAHFGWLGATPTEVVAGAARDPALVLAHIFGPAQRLYLVELLAPLAFLPLLAPRRLLVALPMIGLNLLSALPDATRIVDCHYSALAVPGLVAAAVFGAARLGGWTRPWIGRALLVAGALGGAALLGAAPGLGGHPAELYTLDARADRLEALVAQIPADAGVSAPADVIAHVAGRKRVEVFPRGLGDVDVALADREPRPIRGVPPETQRARVDAALDWARAHGYVVVAEDGPLVLLRR